MQKLLLLACSTVIFLFPALSVSGQNLLNGDFELNSGFCIINGGNSTITSNLNNTDAYGTGQEIDLMNNGCGYGTAYSGTYFLCLANSSGTSPDACTMELSSPLVSGQSYTLYYHDRGYDVNGCCPPGVPIEVGVSTASGTQGTVVYTSPVPVTNAWSLRVVNFVAPNSGQYLSIQAQNNNTRWTHLDCFSLDFSACCAPYTLVLTPQDATCSLSNGMAVASVSGGGTFTYSWNTLPIQTTDTAFNLAPGTYSVTVTDTNGCSGTDSVTIANVNLLSLAVTPSAPVICAGDSVILTASGAGFYSWYPSTGLSSTSDSSVVAAPDDTITYTITGSLSACVDSVQVTVAVTPLPLSTIIAIPDSACPGIDVTLAYTGSSLPAANYLWDFDSGIISSGSGQGPYQVHWNTGGIYYVTLVVTENGCTSLPDTQQVQIFNPPIPEFNIAPPEICEGKMVQVYYLGNAAASADYLWSFGSGTILTGTGKGPYILQYNSSGQEIVNLTVTEHGCPSSFADTLQVHPLPIAAFTVSDTTGCDTISVQFTNLSSGADGYQWNFGDGTTDSSVNPVKLYGPGSYEVKLIASTQFGCMDTFIFLSNINVYLTPQANFTADPPENIPVYLDDAYFQFTNLSVNAASFWWMFGDSTFSDLDDPSHQYNAVGDYTVTLYAYDGTCVDTAMLSFLMVDYNPGYFLPNAFSPNGDGINDVFSILGFHIQSAQMSIFNRWGQLIFQSSDIDQGWDGRVKGKSAEIGTYVYVVNLVFVTGERSIAKGSLTLVR